MKKNNLIKNKIYFLLQHEIGNKNVCLLDLPNYANPGDQLIWEGVEQALKDLKISVKYRASLHFFNPKMILKDDIIVLNGGGNFGDLYSKHQKFREYIINNFPKNKIIILSSTIHFKNEKNLNISSKIFSKHPQLSICARDLESFKILKKKFKNNKIYLLSDMAFAIKTLKNNHNAISKNMLFICREDSELGLINKNSLNFIPNLVISDWPINNKNIFKTSLELLFISINKLILKIFNSAGLHWSSKFDIYGIIKFYSKESQINNAVNFVSKYNLIITTRLHGHILANLLGIPNILLDNSYGKNKNFFNTWMKNNIYNAHYAETPNDVKMILKEHFPNIYNNN